MKILHIDTDLQQLNRIHKDGSNLVSQITDKANNVAFVGSCNYVYKDTLGNSVLRFNNVNSELTSIGTVNLTNLNSFTIRVSLGVVTTASTLLGKWVAGGASGCEFLLINGQFRISKTGSTINNSISMGLFPNRGDLYFMFQRNITTYRMMIARGRETENHYTVDAVGDFPISELPPISDTPILINKTSDNINKSTLDYRGIVISEGTPFDLNNYNLNDVISELGTKKFIKYTHYKRYANKSADKINLASTRYLENAVIDSNDNISDLQCEGATYKRASDNEYLLLTLKGNGAQLPKYTNKGVYFDGSVSDQRLAFFRPDGQQFSLSTFNDKIFISVWFQPMDLIKQGQYVLSVTSLDGATQYVSVVYNHSTNQGAGFIFYDNSNIFGSPLNYPVGSYVHVAALKDDATGVLYWFLDGILIGTTTPLWDWNNGGLGTQFKIQYGDRGAASDNAPICYMDDFMFSLDNQVLNPATFVSGPKKFEPPRRRSLEVAPPFIDLPLIDLRSNNVNKDGSNNVQTAYNYPIKSQNAFRDNGSNCIENGDGFDFSANVNGYLKGATNKNLNDFFIGFWVKLTTLNPTGERVIYSHDFSAGSRGWRVFLNNKNCLLFFADVGLNIFTGLGYGSENSTEWRHFAFSRMGTLIKFFRDGVPIETSNISAALTTNNNTSTIGNAQINTTKKFDGYIDNLEIYDYAKYNNIAFTPPKRTSE